MSEPDSSVAPSSLPGPRVLSKHSRPERSLSSFPPIGRQAIRYRSARDPKGANIALLTCRGFAKAKPLEPHTWRIRIGSLGVQAICEFPERRLEFSRTAFADPRLANMRWERGR